ncbi:MAG: conjugal transfer protein TraX, partial [Ruminococcus sp.]
MSNLRTKENKGIFSGNMLKIFALICMTIDHIGLYLMDNSYPMRAIGRLAFPIFAYMIAEGCKYTHNRTWYFYTIFIMGLAFQTICILADNNYHMNIFITFSLSILLIYSLDYGRNNSETVQWQFPILAVMFVLFVSEIMPMFFGDINYGIDYGFFGITLPLMVYLFDKKELKLIMFTVGLILLCLTR